MGMYDSFYSKVKCPYCGIEREMEIQTKQLGKVLYKYREGDTLGSSIKIRNGSIREEALCDKCGKWFIVDLVIENGKFEGAKNPRKKR